MSPVELLLVLVLVLEGSTTFDYEDEDDSPDEALTREEAGARHARKFKCGLRSVELRRQIPQYPVLSKLPGDVEIGFSTPNQRAALFYR
jgi:hypothetical protein